MAQVAPNLPTRFPCWCRATYSWGGETKRDLGFVEGDLIECLNAGDGSWWMGRLRRDKRAMGLFPSNFVQVLDDSFRPMSRVSSPMPSLNGGSLSNKSSPGTPQKSKTFRKPFQAYTKATSPNPPTTPTVGSRSQAPSPRPHERSNHIHSARVASPSGYKPMDASRASSPCPPAKHQQQAPTGYQLMDRSRASSPCPPANFQQQAPTGYTSPHPIDDSSPPPPAPPPHRVAYQVPTSRGAPSPTPSMNDRYPSISRGQSPVPHSPSAPGLTPSPLRDAMEDVMSSLHDMAFRQDTPSPSPMDQRIPTDPWSPEAFEELQRKPQERDRRRPRSSLGIGGGEDDHHVHDDYDRQSSFSYKHCDPRGNPAVNDYAQDLEYASPEEQKNHEIHPNELFLPDDRMGPPPTPPKRTHSIKMDPTCR